MNHVAKISIEKNVIIHISWESYAMHCKFGTGVANLKK